MQFQRKNIRLSTSRYVGKQIYFVTFCCQKRHPVFSNEYVGHSLATRLFAVAARESFIIHADCIMPDHLHVLLEGLKDTSNQIHFVSAFKQKTGFTYQKRFGWQLWQSKNYDHILRKAAFPAQACSS